MKIEMVSEGQHCPACGGILVKRSTKTKKRRIGQTYAFKWHLFCPDCLRIFIVEEAKYELPPEKELFGDFVDKIASADGPLAELDQQHLRSIQQEKAVPERHCAKCLRGLGGHCRLNLAGGCEDFMEVGVG